MLAMLRDLVAHKGHANAASLRVRAQMQRVQRRVEMKCVGQRGKHGLPVGNRSGEAPEMSRGTCQ